MTDRFNRCVDVVFKNEGILSDDLNDPGGLTKYGISHAAYPHLDVKNLTIDEAKEIYHKDYWLPVRGDEIEDENIALQIFDFAVNAGVKRSIMTAQRLCGVYVDGFMGPYTIGQINEMGHCFITRFIFARKEYYNYLAKIKPQMNKYLNGWLSRVERTKV